ncbi:MAG: hypothetical protein CVV59_01890, partial [Tenericutes bacterium HGW-Tenericutes-4]
HNAQVAESFLVFNSEGYIQSQPATSVFQYGFNTSDKSGCGWIAVYNVLRYFYNEGIITIEPEIENVIKPLDQFAAFGFGSLGTNPLVIKWLLKSQGFKVEFVLDRTKFEQEAKTSTINIIAYLSKNLNRAHYQMIEYDEVQNDFIFYTSASRKSMSTYLAAHEDDYTFLITISI